MEASDVKFEVSSFPDGQQDIKLLKPFNFWIPGDDVQINSRFNNFKDLELIICATKALRGIGIEKIHLHTPYILGARSDRKFVDGGTSYLRDVIAPILNAQNYASVTCLDVHSDVAEATINNLSKIDNTSLVMFALGRIYPLSGFKKLFKRKAAIRNNYTLVSPDGGSLKKIYKVAESLSYKDEIVVCSKHRDEQGKLTKTVVPLVGIDPKKDFIIIDDICDGGRTFINIAKAIKANEDYANSRIFLVVTHGIFSNGLEELSKYFNGIYCSNSYSDNPYRLDGNYNGYSREFVQQSKIL